MCLGLALPAVALCILSLAPASFAQPSCTAPAFAASVTADVGLGPLDVAVADFDRDGALDVATADQGFGAVQGSVTVRWGNGSGGFGATATTILLGLNTGPEALTVGDFDRNGTPDIAVVLGSTNRVRPILKDPSGRTFTLGTEFQPNNNTTDSITVSDVDRDGDLDLVTSGRFGGFTFSRNNGSGAFTNVGGPFPSGTLVGVAVADFNRDGFQDVALAREGAPSDVLLYLNNQLGGWATEAAFTLSAAAGLPKAIAARDVNEDGRPDLVVATDGALVVTLLGDGEGGFPSASRRESDFTGGQTDVVLADFDRDGILDAAVAQPGSSEIRIGLGDGSGSFSATPPLAAEPVETKLAVGDFDEDGRADIAGAAFGNSDAVLRLSQLGIGCPSASFARGGRLQPLVNGPTAMASGDWNDDGIPDVVTAGSLALSILTGDGKLGFSSAVDIALTPSGNPKSIAVADLDVDGDVDLAVTSQITNVLLLRNSAGAFTNAGSLPVGTTAYAVTAGDYNGDGAPDLVTINRLDTSLTFFPGLGDLTFGPLVNTPIGFGAMSALAAGDIDGDGRLDVVVTSDANNVVRWYKGDGAGGFTLGGNHPVGSFPVAVAVGDLNGDTRPDLAVANALSDNVAVLLNQGGGGFSAAAFYPAGDTPRSVAIGDANADGRPDLVVANRDTHDVTVLLGDGAGSFPTSRRVPGHNSPERALLLDADRNGRADLVVTTSPTTTGGNVAVFPGDGLGGFGPVQIAAGAVLGMATGDFDRDGRTDLLTVASGATSLAFHKGQGDGTFAAPVTFATGLFQPNSLGVGDFDRDGDQDVVASSSGTQIALLVGDGNGSFSALAPVASTMSTAAGTGLAVGDFDRDGALDVAKANVTDNSVTVHFGNGAGGFSGVTFTLSVGLNPAAITTLDYNRDGILDLAVANFSSNTVSLLQGSGTRASAFSVATTLTVGGAGTAPAGLAVGDFNRDGLTDLAVTLQGTTPGRVAYFRGTGSGLAAQDNYPVDASLKVQPDGIAAADVNADGRLDLVAACRGRAEMDRFSVRVLLGTGSSVAGAAFGAADVWNVALRQPSRIAVDDFDGDGRPDFAAAGLSGSANDTIPVVLNSNCRPRRLRLTQTIAQCGFPGVPFATQPSVQVEDDGANPIQCDAGSVAAAIVPGSGSTGATLSGENPLATTAGVADWSTASPPLSIDLAGRKYRLQFTHPDAGLTWSRTFSLQPTLTITGPTSYCASAAGFFSTDPGFDTYRWHLDGTGPTRSWTPSLTIDAGTLSPPGHSVSVAVTADTCPASASHDFALFDDLSNVAVTPAAPASVCAGASCTGPLLDVAETGGGPLTTRRWGYRTTSGSGPFTWLVGQTGAGYQVRGSDFPGVGRYYLAVETTPQCGVPRFSNEVEIDVTAETTADAVPAFTIRSTSGQDRLEWIYPQGFGTVAIRYRTHSSWIDCDPPNDVSEGATDIPDQTGTPGGHGLLDHDATNDTTYCYSIFAKVSSSPDVYSSTGLSVRGRPFSTAGPVKWAFSMGSMAMSAPGLGAGILHAVSNDGFLHAMEKGASGGSWPSGAPGWSPYRATGPSQSRPTNVPFSPPPPNALVYLGSQSGAGNNAVAVDADTGQGHAGVPLGKPIQAGPAGMFTAYTGAIDAILLGTRQGGAANEFHALDPATLNPLPGWPYSGEASPPNRIGIVSSQAAVDYATDRVYFTSYQHTPGVSDSVWCLDLVTASRCSLWTPGASVVAGRMGDIAASPTLRGDRLYVSPINGVNGEVEALSTSDGSLLWGAPFQPLDGQVKLFMVPDLQSPDLYFSTTSTVWSIHDSGTGAVERWRNTSILSPSQPVFFAATGRVYVGGGDGKLHVLSDADGTDVVSPITLGDGLSAVGAPTVDQAGGFVYVGTDAGVVYAVAIP
jgi:hypothetical protein